MKSLIQKRLTYANVAMTLALVLAMSGGAYAASKYVITSTKQIKPSVLKQLQGKAGAKGLAGPQGTAGAAGATGAKGETGLPGAEGKAGNDGANGVSVTSKPIAESSSKCEKLGGAELTAAEAKVTTVCNGKSGTTGFTKTLPEGETETGTWAAGAVDNKGGEPVRMAISFAIPLLVAPAHAERVTPESSTENCPGNAAEPTAKPGYLCIYEARFLGFNKKAELSGPTALNPGGIGAGKTGAEFVMQTLPPENPGEFASNEGSWAVTAEK